MSDVRIILIDQLLASIQNIIRGPHRSQNRKTQSKGCSAMSKARKEPQRAISRTRGGLSPDKYLSKPQQQKLLSYIKAQADLSRARGSKRGVIDELICRLL